MKQFFKTMFASVLGALIAFGILILGGIFLLVGMIASVGSSTTETTPKANSVFKLTLSGSLADQAYENPLQSLKGEDSEEVSLRDVVQAIRLAKENDKIKGIYLDVKSLRGGFASFGTIRRELESFKKSGKFIVAYGDDYSQGNYYLASVADSVFVNPIGGISLVGLASRGVFYKNLAAKLGVEFNIFKVGTFKSAVEPYMLEQFSDANREQLTSLLGSIWSNMLDAISQSRQIQKEELVKFIDNGLFIDDSKCLIEHKLADKLYYRNEAENIIKQMAGQDVKKKMVTVSLKNMLAVKKTENKSDNKIAVLYAEGQIQAESNSLWSSTQNCITESTADDLRKLAADDDVKAVVFRVNSPGGSAYISEQIWKAVVELKAKKPVVVSMGDYAASGGYYISCAANQIVAEPSTLTGSIGVFGIVPNLAGTYKKLEVTTDVVKTNTFADLGDYSRPMNDDEKALIQHSVERTYDLFTTRCSDGRSLPKDSIDHIGQGRVWTGEQALARGLVDKLGGMDEAVETAASLANLTDYKVYKANKDNDFLSDYLEKLMGEAKVSLLKSCMGEEYQLFSTMQSMRTQQGIQARMPYTIQGF